VALHAHRVPCKGSARSVCAAETLAACCADYLFHAATSPAFRDATAALAARAQALLQRFEARPFCDAKRALRCALPLTLRLATPQGWPPGVGLEDEAEACDALTGA
jgi:hypothetical protein